MKASKNKVSNELYRSGKTEVTKIPHIKVVTDSKSSLKVMYISLGHPVEQYSS